MTPEDEIKVARREDNSKLLTQVQQVVTQADTLRAIEEIDKITVSAAVEKYIMDIIWKTRTSENDITIGASPRSTRDLYNACKAYAGLMGRDFVLPEDVQKMTPNILLHRMSYVDADTEKQQRAVLSSIMEKVKVPLEE